MKEQKDGQSSGRGKVTGGNEFHDGIFIVFPAGNQPALDTALLHHLRKDEFQSLFQTGIGNAILLSQTVHKYLFPFVEDKGPRRIPCLP
jgi:hypothetical protein